ncbi:MAG: urease accessory protein UreH domain-containing protein [Anaerolineae bacterium]
MPGFLLGLSSGVACMATCAPVLVPYLIGQGRGVRAGYGALALFLGGRLSGYLAFAVLAWLAGLLLRPLAAYRVVGLGASHLAIGALLLFWGLAAPPELCAGKALGARLGRIVARQPALWPLGLGLLTGLNVCPPFLAAVAGAAATGSLGGSIAYFAAFFVGTSVYLVPAPLLGALGRRESLRTVGRLAAIVVSVYYLINGLVVLAGGIGPS